jgi:hypothetical protein
MESIILILTVHYQMSGQSNIMNEPGNYPGRLLRGSTGSFRKFIFQEGKKRVSPQMVFRLLLQTIPV